MRLLLKFLLNYLKQQRLNLFILSISHLGVTGLPSRAYLCTLLEYNSFAIENNRTIIVEQFKSNKYYEISTDNKDR